MANFNITVGVSTKGQGDANAPCVSNVGVPKGGTKNFKCKQTLIGRYLYLKTNLKASLVLCEVRVFGEYVQST